MLVLRMKSDGDFPQVRIHGCLIPGGFVGAEPCAAGSAQCASRATAAALAKVHPRKHGRLGRVATAFYGVRTSKRILHGRLFSVHIPRRDHLNRPASALGRRGPTEANPAQIGRSGSGVRVVGARPPSDVNSRCKTVVGFFGERNLCSLRRPMAASL